MSHVDASLQRKALLVMTGDQNVTSSLDSLGHLDNVYEINGTNYSLSGQRLRSHDFTDYIRLLRSAEDQRLIYNLAARNLPEFFLSNSELDLSSEAPVYHEVPTIIAALESPTTIQPPNMIYATRDSLHQHIRKFLFCFVSFIYLFYLNY